MVFDLDDTLYPERSFVLSGFRASSDWLEARHSVSGFYDQAAGLFEEGLRGTIFNEALARVGLAAEDAMVKSLIEVYRGHAPRIALHEDAVWALDHFGAKLALGLLTDGYAATQRNKVAALDIAGRFQTIVYTDDLGRERWKPSPAPYLKIMEATGRSGVECIYVADNPLKDFVAPNALGWMTVQVLRDGGEYANVVASEGHQAQHRVTDLYRLEQLICV